MRNAIIAVLVLGLLGGAGYAYLYPVDTTVDVPNPDGTPSGTANATFSSNDLGLSFQYPGGPSGYVLEERTPNAEEKNVVRTLVLMQAEDAARPLPEGGEGPPTITINVLRNTANQSSRVWADANVQYSNINLAMGAVEEAVVGGANAIRYMADGLYASENVVVAHGGYVYVFTGMFLDQNSELRRDFAPVVASVRFIPAPGQE